MKSIYKIIVLAALVIMASSCNEFLDVNDNPNRATDVNLAALLPTTIEGTSRAQYSIANSIMRITQHIGSVSGYSDQWRISGAWSTIYLKNMANLDQIIKKAGEENSPHYAGAAKVLMAINLGMLTDLYEDVPYSEALDGSGNLTPKYDSQESIYEAIQSLASAAITDLSATESVFTMGSDDLVYSGSVSKWIKLANTVKARYALHILAKGGAASEVVALANQGLTDNAENFSLYYNDVNFNPWHQFVALANNTGNLSVTIGSQMITTLDGSIHGVVDPRLPIIADKGDSESYIGVTPFLDDAPAYTVDFTEDTWYSTQGAPVVMYSAAENSFIIAEAEMVDGDKTAAYAAYLMGIRQHMTMLGVAAADMDAYLMDANVAVGADNLTMADIMKEKYIALFLNPESWVDMRRYEYSDQIFEGFMIPDPIRFNGPVQRSLYPQNEFNRNGANVTAVEKDMEVKMWRDQ